MTYPHSPIKETEDEALEKLDLHELVEQYQSQPDLLKLILASKVEEDKRRAEEAKLRTKELDVYLLHHSCPNHHHLHSRKRSLSSIHSSSSSSSSSPPEHTHQETTTTVHSDDEHTNHDAIMDQQRNSAAAAMLALASDDSLSISYPSPDSSYDDDNANNERQKKRREMQAITKIVETREFPYQDNYFWKNNGNTTQKKTGCKSIYYKCSNTNKGCAVNKTVTARPNGEYLIKYRGQHLPECGRVERVCDL